MFCSIYKHRTYRFQVTVRNAQGVQVGNSKDHLGCIEPCKILVKDALPIQLKEEMPSVDEVQHQVQLACCLHRKQEIC